VFHGNACQKIIQITTEPICIYCCVSKVL
jgi:hypothetical protein